jgi:hypothetical protein
VTRGVPRQGCPRQGCRTGVPDRGAGQGVRKGCRGTGVRKGCRGTGVRKGCWGTRVQEGLAGGWCAPQKGFRQPSAIPSPATNQGDQQATDAVTAVRVCAGIAAGKHQTSQVWNAWAPRTALLPRGRTRKPLDRAKPSRAAAPYSPLAATIPPQVCVRAAVRHICDQAAANFSPTAGNASAAWFVPCGDFWSFAVSAEFPVTFRRLVRKSACFPHQVSLRRAVLFWELPADPPVCL